MTEALASEVMGVSLTENAVRRIRVLIEQEGDPGLLLRVYVAGGGCSGFQYGFEFAQQANEDDTRVESGGVALLVDPLSLQYLAGAEVDFVENLQGSQFVINNPNASTTCGCGSSFSV